MLGLQEIRCYRKQTLILNQSVEKLCGYSEMPTFELLRSDFIVEDLKMFLRLLDVKQKDINRADGEQKKPPLKDDLVRHLIYMFNEVGWEIMQVRIRTSWDEKQTA